MKPCLLRPRARQDRLAEVRYYRREAVAQVAGKLVQALAKALRELAREPGIGSPRLGQWLGIAGLRSWRIDGFPLSFWYVERAEHVDVLRLVGQRQDAGAVEV